MQQKLTRNTFNKARNTDQDRNKISPEQYMEAHNVELVGDGTFYSLKNIKGTVNLADILGGDLSLINECLGVFRTYWQIESDIHQCLTIFTLSTSNLFKIWCYDIDANTLYEVYEETVTADYDTADRIIDAQSYAENGVDHIYFTDNYHELRQIICTITSYTPNFLTPYSISLQRRGGLGYVEFAGMTTGSLLSGTYQFAYRMANPLTKTFTKWSSLTNPIHAYSSSDVSNIVYSGVGLPTPFGITINIQPTLEEISAFDYFQVAVIENIFPTTITTIGSLLPLELTANRLSYQYKANIKIGEIPIDDLVVDQAQIKTAKTLKIKQNRLFLGNIQYTNLSYDNGDPEITSGSILSSTDGTVNPFSDQEFATEKRGYFRDEVYRFGVVYSDKYGNSGPVKALDLSTVMGNGTTFDIKFPSRSSSPTYSIFDISGNIQSLGLQIIGLKNHPTWATRVKIVRVKRMKNIQFQTPVVPMMSVSGIGAVDNYPTQSTAKAYPNALPQTSSEILVPKNFFWPELRSVQRNATTFSTFGNVKKAGEAYFSNQDYYNVAQVYPQSTMYGDTAFNFSGAEKLSIIDYALLKSSITDYNSAVLAGDDVNTSISGTFYANDYRQYFFDPLTVKSIPGSLNNIGISTYEYLPNVSDGTEIAGASLEKYDLLQTTGVDLGKKPTISAAGVFKLQLIIPEAPTASVGFLAGTFHQRAFGGGNFIVDSSGVAYDATPVPYTSNKYINEYPSYNSNSYVGILGIANVTIGLGDDRYGNAEATHEYISTGASYTFSSAEITNIQNSIAVPIDLDVWGGDCFIGIQTFKVSDSAYSIVNAEKWYGATSTDAPLRAKWNDIVFNNFSGIPISLPVAVKNAAQFVQVIIESEYNGAVRDLDVLGRATTSAGIPVLAIGSESLARSPLTYKYNLNLSKQNDQKVYFPTPSYTAIQNNFTARILYSDLKIYNTAEQGFDIFRVLNFFDLEEKRGAITKLALAGDSLYAVQLRGIVYLPTGKSQLEQTDGGTLSVGTSDVIGRPIVVDSERGSQHLRGIVETGKTIFIPDNINKAVYALQGETLTNITSETENNTLFRTLFAITIPEKNLIGIYDPVKMEYWLADNLNYNCQIFNEKFGFIGDYEFSADSRLEGGAYADQKLYLIGKGTEDTDKLAVHEMYTGPNNSLMGEIVVPRVVISINPDEDISKVFDNTMLAATDRLDSIDFEVTHESSLSDQTTTVDLSAVESVEGNFRVKVLLDSANSRLRGARMIATVKWGELTSTLSALYTKYRLSRKTPF